MRLSHDSGVDVAVRCMNTALEWQSFVIVGQVVVALEVKAGHVVAAINEYAIWSSRSCTVQLLTGNNDS